MEIVPGVLPFQDAFEPDPTGRGTYSWLRGYPYRRSFSLTILVVSTTVKVKNIGDRVRLASVLDTAVVLLLVFPLSISRSSLRGSERVKRKELKTRRKLFVENPPPEKKKPRVLTSAVTVPVPTTD